MGATKERGTVAMVGCGSDYIAITKRLGIVDQSELDAAVMRIEQVAWDNGWDAKVAQVKKEGETL